MQKKWLFITIIGVLGIIFLGGINNSAMDHEVITYVQPKNDSTNLNLSATEKLLTLQTKNVTRVNQDNGVLAAIETSQMVWPATNEGNRPNTVLIGIKGDWRVNLPAVSLIHYPNNGPLLYAEKDKIPVATMDEIHRLNPKGRQMNHGTQIILIGNFSNTVRNKLKQEGWKVDVIKRQEPANMAKQLDAYHTQLDGGKFPNNIIIGSMDMPDYALPAVNWIAHMPSTFLYVTKNSIPKATLEALQQRRNKANIYLLGPEKVISKQIEDQLQSYGKVTRISGNTPQENAIAFAQYKDPATQFGWGITQPGHGLTFHRLSNIDSSISSAAFAHLGKHAPMLILEKSYLSEPLKKYIISLQPSFTKDPKEGPYNHAYLIGTVKTIPFTTQGMIDELLEIKPKRGEGHGDH